MKVQYKSRKLQKICTNADVARKVYGVDMARKIHQRIDEISAADTVEMMVQFGIGGCHSLKGDRKNQYAMTLVQPYRLVFIKSGREIQVAEVQEIVDYH